MSLPLRKLQKEFVIIIIGATGTGKSNLAIELAILLSKRFELGAVILNSDKIQIHRGLNKTTNKVPFHKRKGVPHYLLSVKEPFEDVSPSEYRFMAETFISTINERGNIPILVGGSNSWIHALVVEQYDPASSSFSSDFRYEICFLWLDVKSSVLSEYSSERVDKLLESEDILTELADFFDRQAKDLELDSVRGRGLGKAIGFAEFLKYFKKYPPPAGLSRQWKGKGDVERKAAYEEAVCTVKQNTSRLVKRQMKKIQELKMAGWNLQRLDATAAFEGRGTSKEDGCREKLLEHSLEIVAPFVKKWMKEKKEKSVEMDSA